MIVGVEEEEMSLPMPVNDGFGGCQNNVLTMDNEYKTQFDANLKCTLYFRQIRNIEDLRIIREAWIHN